MQNINFPPQQVVIDPRIVRNAGIEIWHAATPPEAREILSLTIRTVMGPPELDCTAVHTGGYYHNQTLLAVTTD